MDDQPLDLGILLGLAYGGFVDRLNRRMREAGYDDLGPSHGYVFRALADGSMTLSELAAGLGMTTQGAAKIVNQMEGQGYLRRRPDPDDGRARRLELDRRGKAALASARRIHGQLEEDLVRESGPRAVASTRRVLSALLDRDDAGVARRLLRPM